MAVCSVLLDFDLFPLPQTMESYEPCGAPDFERMTRLMARVGLSAVICGAISLVASSLLIRCCSQSEEVDQGWKVDDRILATALGPPPNRATPYCFPKPITDWRLFFEECF